MSAIKTSTSRSKASPTPRNQLSDFIGAPAIGMNITDFQNSVRTADAYLNGFAFRKTLTSLDLSNGQFISRSNQTNTILDVLDGKVATAAVNLNDNASSKLRTINGLIMSLPNSKTIYVNTVSGGNTGPVNEFGGVWQGGVRQYAYGGIHEGIAGKIAASMPSFAAGGLARLPHIAAASQVAWYAELSTQGEAFIPFAPDRRRRAEDILGLVAHRFSGAYIPERTLASMPAASAALPATRTASASGLLGVAIATTQAASAP